MGLEVISCSSCPQKPDVPQDPRIFSDESQRAPLSRQVFPEYSSSRFPFFSDDDLYVPGSHAISPCPGNPSAPPDRLQRARVPFLSLYGRHEFLPQYPDPVHLPGDFLLKGSEALTGDQGGLASPIFWPTALQGLLYASHVGGTSLTLEKRYVHERNQYLQKVTFGSGIVRVGFVYERGQGFRVDLRGGLPQGGIGLNVGHQSGLYSRLAYGKGRVKHFRGGTSNFKLQDLARSVAGYGPAEEISFKTKSWAIASKLAERKGIDAGLRYFIHKNPEIGQTDTSRALAREALKHGTVGPLAMAVEYGGMLGTSLLVDGISRQFGVEPNPIVRGLVSTALPVTAMELYKARNAGQFASGFKQGFRSTGHGTASAMGCLALNMGGQFLTGKFLNGLQHHYQNHENHWTEVITRQGTLMRRSVEVTGGVGTQVAIPKTAQWIRSTALRALGKPLPVATGAITSRVAAGSLLRRYGPFAVVGLASYGIGRFYTDYQKSVSERVADWVYDRDVYTLDTALDYVTLPLKGLRIFCRTLAPSAMNAAIAHDNPESRTAILMEDLNSSRRSKLAMKELVKIYLTEKDGNAPHELVSSWTKRVKISETEKAFLDLMNGKGLEVALVETTLSPSETEEALKKFLVQQIQIHAANIAYVDQEETQWARRLFDEEGRLKPGTEGDLFRDLELDRVI